jgi:hypothetical protein
MFVDPVKASGRTIGPQTCQFLKTSSRPARCRGTSRRSCRLESGRVPYWLSRFAIARALVVQGGDGLAQPLVRATTVAIQVMDLTCLQELRVSIKHSSNGYLETLAQLMDNHHSPTVACTAGQDRDRDRSLSGHVSILLASGFQIAPGLQM